VSWATCCIEGYFQITTEERGKKRKKVSTVFSDSQTAENAPWFCAWPAEKPCVVTSSFELRLKSILQTCSNRQRVSLVTAIRGKRKRAHLIHLVENEELVVVSSTGELSIRTPLETANLLLVNRNLVREVILDADVAVNDEAVVRAGGEDVIVPGESADYEGREQ
jgi:hypothetical protein